MSSIAVLVGRKAELIYESPAILFSAHQTHVCTSQDFGYFALLQFATYSFIHSTDSNPLVATIFIGILKGYTPKQIRFLTVDF